MQTYKQRNRANAPKVIYMGPSYRNKKNSNNQRARIKHQATSYYCLVTGLAYSGCNFQLEYPIPGSFLLNLEDFNNQGDLSI